MQTQRYYCRDTPLEGKDDRVSSVAAGLGVARTQKFPSEITLITLTSKGDQTHKADYLTDLRSALEVISGGYRPAEGDSRRYVRTTVSKSTDTTPLTLP